MRKNIIVWTIDCWRLRKRVRKKLIKWYRNYRKSRMVLMLVAFVPFIRKKLREFAFLLIAITTGRCVLIVLKDMLMLRSIAAGNKPYSKRKSC